MTAEPNADKPKPTEVDATEVAPLALLRALNLRGAGKAPERVLRVPIKMLFAEDPLHALRNAVRKKD